MTRIVLVIFAIVCVVMAPQAMAQSLLSTTVKSSKSNTSDRTIGTPRAGGSANKATTVKSSKSNTSDRKGQTGTTGPSQRATTVKSSKSNTSD